MRTRHVMLAAAVSLTVVILAGCGSSGGNQGGAKTQPQKDAYQATSDFVKAAVDQDGKKYCDALTLDLLESTTNAQSDAAKKKCEQQVKSGARNLPLRVSVDPGRATDQDAQTTVRATPPQAKIKLRKEDGRLKVDSVK